MKAIPLETRLIELASEGFTVNEMAAELGISYSTVVARLRSARQRLGAKNTPQTVAIALRRGLIA